MDLSEFLIGIVLAGLFIFFILWPLIMAYACCAILWLILWPFMRWIGACGRWQGMYRVLGVAVKSPVKMCMFVVHR